jgi:hypothetical protein
MTQQEEKQAIIDILDFELFPKFNTYGDKTYDGDFNLIADKILTELSELRKPSEENRARIMELLWVFSCDSTTDPKEITEEIIRAAQNCKPEPSENIGQRERLCLIIDKYLPAEGVGTEREKARMGLLTEITSLLPLPSFITPRNL